MQYADVECLAVRSSLAKIIVLILAVHHFRNKPLVLSGNSYVFNPGLFQGSAPDLFAGIASDGAENSLDGPLSLFAASFADASTADAAPLVYREDGILGLGENLI